MSKPAAAHKSLGHGYVVLDKLGRPVGAIKWTPRAAAVSALEHFAPGTTWKQLRRHSGMRCERVDLILAPHNNKVKSNG